MNLSFLNWSDEYQKMYCITGLIFSTLRMTNVIVLLAFIVHDILILEF